MAASVRAYFLMREARVHQEDARYLFSDAFETRLIVSANARALLRGAELRDRTPAIAARAEETP